MNSYVNNDTDLKNCESKVVGSRRFSFSKSLKNYWHTIVLTGVRPKPPKDIKYALFECNSFMKCCPVMIYIQVQISDSEEINRDSILK